MKQILFLTNNLSNIETHYEMLSLAGIANECGYDSKIEQFNNKDLISIITGFNPCYLFANINIEEFSTSIKKLAQIKTKFPTIKIIGRGIPFMSYNTNAIYENPFIDYIITSEPEFVLKDILNNIPDEEILGLCYSANMQGIQNENRNLIENLDDLPLPNHNLNVSNIELIQVSKGCPIYDFCELKSVIEGNKIRYRSVSSVINEIKNSKKKDFYFLGEVFSFDNNWVKEFCLNIISINIKINWTITLRPNQTNEEIIKLMKKAGCKTFNINFQSSNPDTLKSLDCGYNLEDIIKTIKLSNKYKIKINPTMYIGLPSDNKNFLTENTSFINKYKLKNIKYIYPKPIPGTKFFAYAMINKLIESPLSFEIEKNKPFARTHELSKNDLEKLYTQINSKKNIFNFFIKKG